MTSNEYSSVYLSLGNGDGTFQPRVVVEHNDGAEGMVVADLNGDGNLDFAASDFPSGIVYVVLGNGDGTFQPPLATAFGADPQLLAADVNGDGKLDLGRSWTGNSFGGARPWRRNFRSCSGFWDGGHQPTRCRSGRERRWQGGPLRRYLLWRHRRTYWVGRRHLHRAARLHWPRHSGPVVIADFNGDSNPDVATSYIATAQTGQILLGNGDEPSRWGRNSIPPMVCTRLPPAI